MHEEGHCQLSDMNRASYELELESRGSLKDAQQQRCTVAGLDPVDEGSSCALRGGEDASRWEPLKNADICLPNFPRYSAPPRGAASAM